MELERRAEGCFDDTLKLPQVSQEPLKQCGSRAESTAAAACFDCNICLDNATDPVVSLCGHLYCWPCIYKWLQIETAAPLCPVCKASLSESSLVPLYGRGHSSAAKGSQQSLNIPKRPSAHRGDAEIDSTVYPDSLRAENLYTYSPPSIQLQRQRQRQRQHHHHHYYPYHSAYMPSGPPLPTRVLHSNAGSAIGGIAALLVPEAFRNDQSPGMYYSSPYQFMTNVYNPRLRRQEVQIERSLNQIWAFLLCCALLCLLLF